MVVFLTLPLEGVFGLGINQGPRTYTDGVLTVFDSYYTLYSVSYGLFYLIQHTCEVEVGRLGITCNFITEETDSHKV